MEGSREGIALVHSHGPAAGYGLFIRRADVSMAESQEEAAAAEAKGYLSSPSSPSTASPASSPPPPSAKEDAAATPAAWSLGDETAGDSGVQMSGHSERHAGLSSGRRRGRPKGSGRRQILATLGEWYALSAGGSFTPHVIIVAAGEDVAARIMSFSQKGPRSVCILSANGTIANVALNRPGSSGSTFSYEGQFEILQLTGSFTIAGEGSRRRTGGLSVSLAGPDGCVVGGVVAGMLRAATPIQVIVGSFLPNSMKQHQRRMGLHPQPSPAPALPAPMPPPGFTAAMPISQVAPGNNGCYSSQVSASSMPQQVHAGVEHSSAASGAINLNSSSFSTGFSMVGWPASSQSMQHRHSPDINVCLTPQD